MRGIDLDERVSQLEREWRTAYEAALLAQAHLVSLTEARGVNKLSIESAQRGLHSAEALKAVVFAKIERLEKLATSGAYR